MTENQKGGIYTTEFDSEDFKDFYDIIIKVTSMRSLSSIGWEIEGTEQGLSNYHSKSKENIIVVGVMGHRNRGKSYLLTRLSGMVFPIGTSVNTEGLSLKYPDFPNKKNIIALDTAGFQTPLSQTDTFSLEGRNLSDVKTLEKIKEAAKDKEITENFLRRFVINRSDVLLVMVGQLTFPEQTLINQIKEINKKKETKKKKIFIVHNLFNLSTIAKVEEYIENTLKQSMTFILEKVDPPILNKNNFPFHSFYIDQEQDVHIIFANDDIQNETRNYYNEFAVDFIQKQISTINFSPSFDVIAELKKLLVTDSHKMMEVPLSDEDVVIEEDKRIYVKSSEKIELIEYLMDEFNFLNYYDELKKPGYCYFYLYEDDYDEEDKEKKPLKFVVEIEVFEEVKEEDFKVEAIQKKEQWILKIKRKDKKKNKENKKEGMYPPRVSQQGFEIEICNEIRKLPIIIDENGPKYKFKESKNSIVSFEFELDQALISEDVEEEIQYD